MCGGMMYMPGREKERKKDQNPEEELEEETNIILNEWKGELGGP